VDGGAVPVDCFLTGATHRVDRGVELGLVVTPRLAREHSGAGNHVACLTARHGPDVGDGVPVDASGCGIAAIASAAARTTLMPFSGSTPACAFLPRNEMSMLTDVGDQ
jgi:hypothetical protein